MDMNMQQIVCQLFTPPHVIFYNYYLQKEYIITIFVMNKVAYVAVKMPSTAHI